LGSTFLGSDRGGEGGVPEEEPLEEEERCAMGSEEKENLMKG
jgi:hypothetical protein